MTTQTKIITPSTGRTRSFLRTPSSPRLRPPATRRNRSVSPPRRGNRDGRGGPPTKGGPPFVKPSSRRQSEVLDWAPQAIADGSGLVVDAALRRSPWGRTLSAAFDMYQLGRYALARPEQAGGYRESANWKFVCGGAGGTPAAADSPTGCGGRWVVSPSQFDAFDPATSPRNQLAVIFWAKPELYTSNPGGQDLYSYECVGRMLYQFAGPYTQPELAPNTQARWLDLAPAPQPALYRDASTGTSPDIGKPPPKIPKTEWRVPPGPNVKEQKTKAMKGMAKLLQAAFALTEGKDLVDAMFEALPQGVQNGVNRSGTTREGAMIGGGKSYLTTMDKAGALYRNAHRLDVNEALKNVLLNQAVDQLVGSTAGGASRARRRMGSSTTTMWGG